MSFERAHDHDHAQARATQDSASHDDVAPGRTSRAAQLAAPARPMISRLVQRKARNANGVADGAEHAVADAATSTGAALPDPILRKFEASLGTDLSGVRIHTGGASATAADAVGARAYTVGQDIHFAAGHYDPASAAGQHLIAHEVAHTVQQRGAAAVRQHKLAVSSPHDAAEHDADRAADAMVAGRAAEVSAAPAAVARDVDQDIAAAGAAGGERGARDAKVQVVMGHTVTADQREAQGIIARIDAAEQAVARHPDAQVDAGGGIGPLKGMLAENHQARFVLEQYAAEVAESGNFQSEYAASYQHTKRDHGEFQGLFAAFQAAGGTLKADSQSAGLKALSSDPEFLRARGAFEGVRNQLKNDQNKIREAQIGTDRAKSDLQGAVFGARAAAGRATAKKKQDQLNAVIKSIDDAVGKIMMVAQLASTVTTGVIAMGSGGADISKLVESSPEIAPADPPPGGASATPSLAPPDIRHFAQPGSDLNPAPAMPEDGLGKPGDTRTYAMPSQAADTAKSLAGKGLDLAGGPEKLLKAAITKLEEAKLDRIQAQIDAANEDGNLNDAAAAAAKITEKRLAYQKELTTLVNNVGNLMDHKKQMDTAVKDMVAAAKRRGGSKDLTGAIRLVGSADKFLAQVDMTINLGEQQQNKGHDARRQRYDINGEAFSAGTVQGPGQLHYWMVARRGDDFVATKQRVELQASGSDSLVSGATGNSTQFDTGKSLEELKLWRDDVQAKRAQAEGALGLTVSAGQSS